MQVLTQCINEDVAILPDQFVSFRTKDIVDPLGGKLLVHTGILPSSAYDLELNFSALGLVISTMEMGFKKTTSSQAMKQVGFWSYHDFIDWSVCMPDGKMAFQFSVYESGPGSKRLNFVMRTPDALQLSTCLEFFIEKYQSFTSVQAEFEYLKQLQAEGLVDTEDHSPDETSTSSTYSFRLPHNISELTDLTALVESHELAARNKKAETLTISQRLKRTAWLHDLMLNKEGPLFDDSLLQIAARVVVDGATAELTLFFRNHGVIDINDLESIFSGSSDCLGIEARILTRPDLSPGGVRKQLIFLTYMDVCPCDPNLSVSYTNTETGHQSTQVIRLPITVSSFMKPWGLTVVEFLNQWETLISKDLELTEVYQTPPLLNPFAVLAVLEEVHTQKKNSLLF
jgi:hypothetical protein